MMYTESYEYYIKLYIIGRINQSQNKFTKLEKFFFKYMFEISCSHFFLYIAHLYKLLLAQHLPLRVFIVTCQKNKSKTTYTHTYIKERKEKCSFLVKHVSAQKRYVISCRTGIMYHSWKNILIKMQAEKNKFTSILICCHDNKVHCFTFLLISLLICDLYSSCNDY